MQRKMRIVSLGTYRVFIQLLNPGSSEWKMKALHFIDFEHITAILCPKEYQEYLNSGTDLTHAEWFYQYGEPKSPIHESDIHVFNIENWCENDTLNHVLDLIRRLKSYGSDPVQVPDLNSEDVSTLIAVLTCYRNDIEKLLHFNLFD